jgi:FkbM family methyltransferase
VSRAERALQGIGHLLTRVLLGAPLGRLRLARTAYAACYLAGKRLAEPRQRAFLRSLVRPGMVVFDVGANLGFYTLLLARWVGEAGCVHAFEPDPEMFELLATRARRAGRRNLELVQAAVGDHAGTATLHLSRTNRADNRVHASHAGSELGRKVTVPLLTLDEHCARHGVTRLDGVKLDVQGAEVAALRGFRAGVRGLRPQWILLELSPPHLRGAGSSPAELFALLDELGYQPWTAGEHGRPRPIVDREGFVRACGDGYTDVWARRAGG